MSIRYLVEDDYWEARINWQPPRKWYRRGDVGVELSDFAKNECGIYRFEGKYCNSRDEILYIGLAYNQCFNDRLHQGYHEKKLKYNRADEIWVSVGIIDLLNGNHTRKRYEEIEKILIYFFDTTLNISAKTWCPECYFKITNEGYKGALPRRIIYPVAEINN